MTVVRCHVFALALALLVSVASAVYSVDSTCQCGIRKPQGTSRIVNGTLAGANEFPWVVGLFLTQQDDGPFCGGALISDRHVLTAAHCIEAVTPRFISLGDVDYKSVLDGSKFAAVTPFTLADAVHPQFAYVGPARAPINDVAIIQLQIPVDFASMPNVRPLCLSNPAVSITSGEAIAAGWGLLKEGALDRSSKLLYTTQDVITNPACASKYANVAVNIIAAHLCAYGKDGSDTCQGDSGGAFFRLRSDANATSPRYELAGITSFEIGCGNLGFPAVYTRATSVLPFIVTQLNKSTAKVCNGIFTG